MGIFASAVQHHFHLLVNPTLEILSNAGLKNAREYDQCLICVYKRKYLLPSAFIRISPP